MTNEEFEARIIGRIITKVIWDDEPTCGSGGKIGPVKFVR